MIEIILHDICDTFPYLKYGLAAAVCTALALTVLNHSRIMDKEKRSNYVSLLGKSMFLAFYGAVLLQVTLLSREPGSRTAADLIPFSTWGTTAQSRAHEIENMIMFLPVGVLYEMFTMYAKNSMVYPDVKEIARSVMRFIILFQCCTSWEC